jgi:hypothetical protein
LAPQSAQPGFFAMDFRDINVNLTLCCILLER